MIRNVSTNPDLKNIFLGYILNFTQIHIIHMTLCSRALQVASLNRFHSNMVHKFAVGVAQNGKLFTQFENR